MIKYLATEFEKQGLPDTIDFISPQQIEIVYGLLSTGDYHRKVSLSLGEDNVTVTRHQKREPVERDRISLLSTSPQSSGSHRDEYTDRAEFLSRVIMQSTIPPVAYELWYHGLGYWNSLAWSIFPKSDPLYNRSPYSLELTIKSGLIGDSTERYYKYQVKRGGKVVLTTYKSDESVAQAETSDCIEEQFKLLKSELDDYNYIQTMSLM